VTEKWECNFDREMNENPEMRDFLENHPMIKIAPLDPRDAFFGGRTGNIVTRYETMGTEKIRYVVVCSLYPYILKTGAFPIDILTFISDILIFKQECTELIEVAPNYNFSSVEGLVRYKVLPLSSSTSVSRARQIVVHVVPKLLRNVLAGCVHSRRSRRL